MKTHNQPGKRIAELRRIIGKSQSQFATMIGASKHSIISVENGRTKTLTKNLAKRIEIATGANLLHGAIESPFRVANYTREDFNRWREKYSQTNKTAALKQFNEMKTWLKVVFLAAAESGRAGNRDRLPAVCLSLAEWLNEARVNFKLEDEIEGVLDVETRKIGTAAHSILALLEQPDKSKKELAGHGIDFIKIKKELKMRATHGWLFIQDEYRDTWGPGGIVFRVLCKPRTLLPEAKYWIKDFKGSAADLEKYGNSHRALIKYLESLDPENSPTPPSEHT